MDKFYLRNKQAGFLGNSPMWYAKDGQGYTAYVMGAEKFTKEEVEELIDETHGKYEAYNCDHVNERLHLIFDEQDKHRLGTDDPCPWKQGYTEPPKDNNNAR